MLGVVLAGGRSSRFGSDKALAEVDGTRLLDRAVALLRTVSDEVAVVSSRPEHDVEGVRRLPDLRTGKGPLGGMEAALAYARDRGSREVHLLVDPENAAALAFYEALGFRRDSWEMCYRL